MEADGRQVKSIKGVSAMSMTLLPFVELVGGDAVPRGSWSCGKACSSPAGSTGRPGWRSSLEVRSVFGIPTITRAMN
jgi:hypothetical protein